MIPIVYAWIYYRIREKNNGVYIELRRLKDIIAYSIRGSIPHFFQKEIMKDMCEMGLIQRIDQFKYKVLSNNCDKKVKKIMDYF